MHTNKTMHALGIPFSALVSVIFGMMLISFPVGSYMFFSTDIGDGIDYDYPLQIPGVSGTGAILDIRIGDLFIIIWAAYIVLFAIAIIGPKKNFFSELVPIMNGASHTSSSYMVSMIRWFAILVLVSAVINTLQESVGISTNYPPPENDFFRFFDVMMAPLVEESIFRVLLIGVPLYIACSYKSVSARKFCKSLWHPYESLRMCDNRRAIILIVLSASLFGLAHITVEDSWSIGKLAQATAGGLIVGWVYFRFGIVPALLLHWATNYFIFAYVYIVADIGHMTITEAFAHPLLYTLEIIFILAGIVSVGIIITERLKSRTRVQALS